jgi:hypothetical protein
MTGISNINSNVNDGRTSLKGGITKYRMHTGEYDKSIIPKAYFQVLEGIPKKEVQEAIQHFRKLPIHEKLKMLSIYDQSKESHGCTTINPNFAPCLPLLDEIDKLHNPLIKNEKQANIISMRTPEQQLSFDIGFAKRATEKGQTVEKIVELYKIALNLSLGQEGLKDTGSGLNASGANPITRGATLGNANMPGPRTPQSPAIQKQTLSWNQWGNQIRQGGFGADTGGGQPGRTTGIDRAGLTNRALANVRPTYQDNTGGYLGHTARGMKPGQISWEARPGTPVAQAEQGVADARQTFAKGPPITQRSAAWTGQPGQRPDPILADSQMRSMHAATQQRNFAANPGFQASMERQRAGVDQGTGMTPQQTKWNQFQNQNNAVNSNVVQQALHRGFVNNTQNAFKNFGANRSLEDIQRVSGYTGGVAGASTGRSRPMGGGLIAH